MADQHAEKKGWAFSSDFKEESEDECLRDRKRVSEILPILGTRKIYSALYPAADW